MTSTKAKYVCQSVDDTRGRLAVAPFYITPPLYLHNSVEILCLALIA